MREKIAPEGKVLEDVIAFNVNPYGKIITDSLNKGDTINILSTHKNGENIYYKYDKDGEYYYALSKGVPTKLLCSGDLGGEGFKMLLWRP